MLESQSASKTKPLIPKEYPLELLKALVAGTSLDPPPKITNDILAGMQYALFTLPADQQKLLHLAVYSQADCLRGRCAIISS